MMATFTHIDERSQPTMPPEPTSEAAPPAIASISGVILSTSGMKRAAASRAGSAL